MTLSDGKVITATEGHPFRTVDGWRDAVLLKKGDILILTGSDGKPSTIQVDEIRYETKVLTTYNLEVANAHTFFVGEDGVLVHNCGRAGKQKRLRELMNDDKAPRWMRGWLRNDLRHMKRAKQPKSGLRIPGNGRKSPGRKKGDKGFELAHKNDAPASHGNDYGGSLVKTHADHKTETRIHGSAGRYD